MMLKLYLHTVLVFYVFYCSNSVLTSNANDPQKSSAKTGLKCKLDSDCGPKESCIWLFGTCNRLFCSSDNDCFTNEFCNKQSRKKNGKCARKYEDETLCFYDIEYDCSIFINIKLYIINYFIDVYRITVIYSNVKHAKSVTMLIRMVRNLI
jgi:hypothetical protein